MYWLYCGPRYWFACCGEPATSVVCFCDPVAPQFSYSAAAQNNYWPESILATNQSMDFDSSGQTYVDNNGQATLACPSPSRGCPFDNGIGLGSADATGSTCSSRLTSRRLSRRCACCRRACCATLFRAIVRSRASSLSGLSSSNWPEVARTTRGW